MLLVGASRIVPIILLLSLGFFSIPTSPFVPAAKAGPSFTFAASGDLGVEAYSNSSYKRIPTTGANFFLALGDLSYNDTTPESRYCEAVKDQVGATFPFEVLSGNHDDGTEVLDGVIDNFAQCLPDRLGATGLYGKEYFFDFPSTSPLARVILISPDLTFANGGHYSYDLGSSHHSWLAGTIDDARAKAIPWVIVAMHKVCVTIGDKKCEIGPDLLKLLFDKKVDLVLQGHDHDYQRSKQLTCEDSPVADSTTVTYVPPCVADDGSDNIYSKGAGIVFVINGAFGGQSFTPVNVTDSRAQYFAKAMGGALAVGGGGRGTVLGTSNDGVGRGFVTYTVSADRIDAQFVMTTQVTTGNSFSDSFSIVNQPNSGLIGWLTGPGRLAIVIPAAVGALGLAFWLGRRSKRTPKAKGLPKDGSPAL